MRQPIEERSLDPWVAVGAVAKAGHEWIAAWGGPYLVPKDTGGDLLRMPSIRTYEPLRDRRLLHRELSDIYRSQCPDICTKLQVADRAQAILRARDAGLGRR